MTANHTPTRFKFTTDAEIIAYGINGLRIIGLIQYADAVAITLWFALSGQEIRFSREWWMESYAGCFFFQGVIILELLKGLDFGARGHFLDFT